MKLHSLCAILLFISTFWHSLTIYNKKVKTKFHTPQQLVNWIQSNLFPKQTPQRRFRRAVGGAWPQCSASHNKISVVKQPGCGSAQQGQQIRDKLSDYKNRSALLLVHSWISYFLVHNWHFESDEDTGGLKWELLLEPSPKASKKSEIMKLSLQTSMERWKDVMTILHQSAAHLDLCHKLWTFPGTTFIPWISNE